MRKGARTRAALLVALQELLLEPGEHPVSVPRLVARAGVAQGTFYNYFDSLGAAMDAVGELLLAEQYRTLLRVIDGATDAAEVVARSHTAGVWASTPRRTSPNGCCANWGCPPRRAARLAGRAQEFQPWRPLPLIRRDNQNEQETP